MAQQGRIVLKQRRVRDWDEHDAFQATLQDGYRLLLTTHRQEESTWVSTCQVLRPQLGTMWDCHVMMTRRVWRASPGWTTASQAQDWLYQAHRGIWVSAQYLVGDHSRIRIQTATRERHGASLNIRAGQQLTALSPPVCVWTGSAQLPGLWCALMAAYHTHVSPVLPMDTVIETDLVPMGTVHRVSDC